MAEQEQEIDIKPPPTKDEAHAILDASIDSMTDLVLALKMRRNVVEASESVARVTERVTYDIVLPYAMADPPLQERLLEILQDLAARIKHLVATFDGAREAPDSPEALRAFEQAAQSFGDLILDLAVVVGISLRAAVSTADPRVDSGVGTGPLMVDSGTGPDDAGPERRSTLDTRNAIEASTVESAELVLEVADYALAAADGVDEPAKRAAVVSQATETRQAAEHVLANPANPVAASTMTDSVATLIDTVHNVAVGEPHLAETVVALEELKDKMGVSTTAQDGMAAAAAVVDVVELALPLVSVPENQQKLAASARAAREAINANDEPNDQVVTSVANLVALTKRVAAAEQSGELATAAGTTAPHTATLSADPKVTRTARATLAAAAGEPSERDAVVEANPDAATAVAKTALELADVANAHLDAAPAGAADDVKALQDTADLALANPAHQGANEAVVAAASKVVRSYPGNAQIAALAAKMDAAPVAPASKKALADAVAAPPAQAPAPSPASSSPASAPAPAPAPGGAAESAKAAAGRAPTAGAIAEIGAAVRSKVQAICSTGSKRGDAPAPTKSAIDRVNETKQLSSDVKEMAGEVKKMAASISDPVAKEELNKLAMLLKDRAMQLKIITSCKAAGGDHDPALDSEVKAAAALLDQTVHEVQDRTRSMNLRLRLQSAVTQVHTMQKAVSAFKGLAAKAKKK